MSGTGYDYGFHTIHFTDEDIRQYGRGIQVIKWICSGMVQLMHGIVSPFQPHIHTHTHTRGMPYFVKDSCPAHCERGVVMLPQFTLD